MMIGERYRVERTLGEGAMGRVELVTDTLSGKQVALKLIGGPGVDAAAEKTLMQFRQEFRLMSRLRHPNCCEVYDFGVTAAGEPFFTMEVVPGHGLDELLPLPPERFSEVFSQLLLALGYVHRQGYVHLDLKSANVRVRPDGTVKLMDFGLMEVAGQGGLPIRGTLPYIAPEVIRRAPLDGRADLYSAGALAYELLTGKPPFQRQTPGEVLRAHLGDAPPRLTAVCPSLPHELDRVVVRLLAKEPAERYAFAEDVLADLGVEPPPGLGGTLLASPLVGRDAELARLAAELAAVKAGGGLRELWLWGPAGVGKSRLLDEVRCAAQLENLPFVRVASHELGRAPYAALTAMLRSLLPGLRTHVPEALARHAPVLAALLPELGAEAAAPMDAPRNEAMRLAAEVTGLLAAHAAAQPFVMLIEDWRGLDESSREVLAYFRRNARTADVLVVASTRRGPAAAGGPDEMPEAALTGLAPEALTRMLAGMLGEREPDPAFVANVADLTGGVPREVEELLERLVKAGALSRKQGRWDLGAPLDTAGLPGGLQARWARQLDELPPAERAVAAALAALGRPAELELLQAITGLNDEVLFAALEALTRRRMIQRDEQGAHGFVRRDDPAVLSELLPAAERVPLHERIFALLSADVGDGPPAAASLEQVAALAHHGVEGGIGPSALPWVLEAARRALGLFALDDARRHLSAADALLAALPADAAASERLLAAWAQADLERFAGRPAAAEPLYLQALAQAERQGDRRTLGLLFTSLAGVHQIAGRYEAARQAADRAVAHAEAARDLAAAARGLNMRGRASFFMGETATAIRDCEQALELAREDGSPAAVASASANLGYFLVAGDPSGVPRGLACLEEAARCFEASGDRLGIMTAQNLLGNVLMARGELAGAERSFLRCREVSAACGTIGEEAFALINLAIVALETGDPAEAQARATRARELAERAGARMVPAMALAVMGQAMATLGQPASARALAAEALEAARALGNKYLESQVLPRLADVQLAGGWTDDAATSCDALEALITDSGNQELAPRLALLRAEISRRRGDPRAAAEGARRAGAESGPTRLAAIAVEARCALDQQAWERARTLAREGLDLAAALGARERAAELHGVAGLAALREGRDEASTFFAEMEAWAEAAQAPIMQAEALFGRAAAAPFAVQAGERAKRAGTLLATVLATLDEPARAALLKLRDLAAIQAGDFKAFGQPAATATRRGSGPLNIGLGGFGP